jgi:hypothetical protein
MAREDVKLMAAQWPGVPARDKFERLWDEANSIAAQTILTPLRQQYLLLLQAHASDFREPLRQ